MLKRFLLVFFILGMATAIAQANTHTSTISGVLTTVGPTTIEVATHAEESRSFTLNAGTKYRKWIMAKPWQQDTHADLKSLKAGMRVRVDVDANNPQIAKTVWVVVR